MDTQKSQNHGLHILFFPFMALSHMLPMLDMAKLFARRGVKVTIVTTPANAAHIQFTDKRLSVELELIPFPSSAVGLPDGCENLAAVHKEELHNNFMEAVAMLRQPFDQILLKLHPNAVIADNFLPWTIKLASNLGIPNLLFNSTGFFPLCVGNSMEKFNPGEEAESFVVPGLPHRIELLKSQLPEMSKLNPAFADLFTEIKEQEPRSYGTVVNSFYELEPDYVEHYRTVMGRRAWHIGPLFLCNENIDRDHSMREDECLAWLEEKQPGSVLYVCCGSLCAFSAEQLREMALGFEASKHPFIWVLPQVVENDEEMDWMPEGYVERIEGKGLIMRRWAPQVLTLKHRAVGGFLTHCGWNSILEAVSAGVVMVTWPLFAEQFYNERLIVDVLGIGVAVGSKDWTRECEKRSVIDAGVIEKAVTRLMSGGEEAEGMRKKARELAAMAKRAVEKGGSSDKDIGSLIHELLLLNQKTACV
ncbi:hypothetical protein J5N97_027985 [Dioscorea zingiberensis]|uniref:Glycosyltransferase n=1 Tax=Dioscorea zingiberensis TaxID=325984 RepID=A0A9D5BY51_9LILI|nr:hypothetical protein J5N97_027985 [Dioscorea zingiberensis]